MRIELLPDNDQYKSLQQIMSDFNSVCNSISEIGFRTKTHTSKIKLSKECYNFIREKHAQLPSNLVVRAIGKVVEEYKSGVKSQQQFAATSHVVYDHRLLSFKWMNRVSISTLQGRIDIPFRVVEYRQGSYERLVTGQADLVFQNDIFFLFLLVDLPDSDLSNFNL